MDGIIELKGDIRAWKTDYGVESPDELRQSITNDALDTEEERERSEIAND